MHHLGSSRKSNIAMWQTFMPDLSIAWLGRWKHSWLYHEGHTPARSLWKSYRYISKCHDIFCSQHLIMTALQPHQTRIFNSGKTQNTSEWNVQLPLKRIKEITLTRICFHFSLNTWFQHHHLTKQIWLNMFQVTTEVDFILLIHQPLWSLLLRQTPF